MNNFEYLYIYIFVCIYIYKFIYLKGYGSGDEGLLDDGQKSEQKNCVEGIRSEDEGEGKGETGKAVYNDTVGVKEKVDVEVKGGKEFLSKKDKVLSHVDFYYI
jgi:hypothetical protein